MSIEIRDICGAWRHKHGEIITDFTIRTFDKKTGKGLSFFTIYGKDSDGKDYNYEWQGAVKDIVDNGDSTFNIIVDQMRFTEDKPEFQKLKIWMLTDGIMTLEFGNGNKVDFNKIK